MMYSFPISPLRFQQEPQIHAPCRPTPRQPCKKTRCHRRPAYGPPAWFLAHTGGPHHHGNAFPVNPRIEDIFGLWKSVAGIPGKTESHTAVKPDWREEVNCRGYTPDEVTLQMSGDKVFLNCNHEQSDALGNTEMRQTKRTIQVPEYVDSEKISATFSKRGVLVLTAPRKTDGKMETEPKETKEIPADNEIGMDEDDSSEQLGEPECECELDGVEDQGETTDSSLEQLDIQKEDESQNSELAEQTPDSTEEQTVDKTSSPQSESKLFELKVDMGKFDLDSVEVKLNSSVVTVTGRQEDKDPSTGRVLASRTMFKRFTVPDSVNCDLLVSTLDKQGQLTISAPHKTEAESEGVVPILAKH